MKRKDNSTGASTGSENTELTYAITAQDIGVSLTQDPNNKDYVIIHAFPKAQFIANLNEDYRMVLHKEKSLFTPAYAEELIVRSMLNRFYGDFNRPGNEINKHVAEIVSNVIAEARRGRK